MFGKERVYAAINLDHIHENVSNIANHISSHTKILAVLKADAYGHGAVMIAKELENMPKVFGYAVATIEEAMEIRIHRIYKPILVLSYCFPSAYDSAVSNDIRLSVFDVESAVQLNEAARTQGKIAKVHIKVDTGMNRIGLTPDEKGLAIVKEIADLPNIEIEGIFTHFARADEKDKSDTRMQLQRFLDFTRIVKEAGINIPMRHCSNSASIIELPEGNMDLVRAGIIMYGLWPSEEVSQNIVNLKPVMELKSTVCYVKEVEEGIPISYGGTYRTKGKTKIATITIGYADGYPRCLSNKGYVLIHGKRANVVGRVCMDQMMVDVTHIPDVCRGDTVTIIGEDGNEMIGMEEFSAMSERINYEAVCDIGKRVPRIYIKKMLD